MTQSLTEAIEFLDRLSRVACDLLRLSEDLKNPPSLTIASPRTKRNPKSHNVKRRCDIKSTILDLIEGERDGLTAHQVKLHLLRVFDEKIGQRSHATLLCRLQSEGRIIRMGRKWIAVDNIKYMDASSGDAPSHMISAKATS